MLSLRRELILKRVNESFGGSLARITTAWPGDDPSDTPHRSTLLRWMKGETQPRSAKQVLGLAGALDVDPFCLWAFDPANFDVLCARIVATARKAKWARFHPALAFLGDFVGPLEKWPPDAIATKYYQRP